MRNIIREIAHDFVLPLTLYVCAVGLLILMAVAWSSRAYAQTPQCGPFEQIEEFLSKQHHELQIGGGIINDQSVMLVYVSPGGETWTLVALGVDGKACLVASGGGWSQRHVPAIGERQS